MTKIAFDAVWVMLDFIMHSFVTHERIETL